MARCPRDGCGKHFWTVWNVLPCPLQWGYEKNPWLSFSLSINYSYFVCECTYLCLYAAYVHTLMCMGTIVYVYMWGHTCTWLCVRRERPELDIRCLSRWLSSFLRKNHSLHMEISNSTIWLVNEPVMLYNTSILVPQVHTPCPDFMRFLRI